MPALIIALAGVTAVALAMPEAVNASVRKVRYGPGLAADSLNNTFVGGPRNQKVAYRFRATTTSRLRSVVVYIVNGESGYSGGNGGTFRVTVRPDDKTRSHRPTNKVLARRDVARPPYRPGVEIQFPSPPRLKKGKLYHVVFENVHSQPKSHYASLDGLFVFDQSGPRQPLYATTDWAQLIKEQGGSWTASRGSGRGAISPIMALKYANGRTSGVGYMEVWSPAPAYISGNRRVREVFTVSGWNRKVAKISVRLKRISGSSPLKLRLLKGSGKPVASGRVSAARIALQTVSDIRRGSDWVTLKLDRRVRLKRGQRYRLVLSTAADTRYALHVIREGKSHGYPPSTFFRDGHAELDTGSGWRLFQRWGNRSDEADLQFFFR